MVLPQKPLMSTSRPFEGAKFYFSGSANDLNNSMTKAFTLGAELR